MKYVIVLGTAQYDGRPSRILAGRLRHAGELATARNLAVITVGGKLPGDSFTEAGVGRTFLREHYPHLTAHAVEQGLDTRSSLKAAKEAFALSDATIITDPLHRLRTALIARQEGLKATVSGTPYYPAARFSTPWWRYLAHETGGVAYALVAGLLPPRGAAALRNGFYRVEQLLRPNQKLRHQTIEQEDRDSFPRR